MATIHYDCLRVHWKRLDKKYLWTTFVEGRKLPDQLRRLILEIEMHCPCGARPESPNTHPHVGGCPVAEALWVLNDKAEL